MIADRPYLGGTDGFRAEATTQLGPGRMNSETVANLTGALLDFQRDAGATGPIVVGQDTRPSGESLRHAVLCEAHRQEVEVVDLGVAPTPTVQKVAERVGAVAAVVISASHNPASDNGWKGMIGGRKPSDVEAHDISNRYWRRVDSGRPAYVPLRQAESPSTEQAAWYVDTLIHDIESQYGASPLTGKIFAVDGAYGAAQQMTPAVLRRLGARVEEFSCDGQGLINDGCGATQLDGLKRFLGQHPELTNDPNFIGALANDGDADRVMGVGAQAGADGSPEFVELTGNHMMWALAEGQPGIVGTEYTNTGLIRRLARAGIDFAECQNGDKFVTEMLHAKRASGEPWGRGGEFTGHLVDLDWLTSGDGVRMAAWFAAYSVQRGMKFGDIYRDLPLWQEGMAKVHFQGPGKDEVPENPYVRAALTEARRAFGSHGRVVLRASGTEPVVRVWAEGTDSRQVDRTVASLVDIVAAQAKCA